MTHGLPNRLWTWPSLTHALRRWWCQERHWRHWKLLEWGPNATYWSCRRCGRTWRLVK
jgi:hypothetical protein